MMAGEQLCILKATTTGRARYVVEDIYNGLKTDAKYLKSRLETQLLSDTDSDSEGPAD